jgi:transcriptional regulator GlxA family with amidase domain
MDASEPPISAALLAVPEMTASSLYGMHDLLAAAGRDWAFLVEGKPGRSLIEPRIVGARTGILRVANNVPVEVVCGLDSGKLPDIVCIPDLFIAPEESIAGRYQAEIRFLQDCYASGATLAAACSGALLLAEAGLLDGQDATTHWGYCDAMSRHYPRVRLHPGRALVVTGDAQRLVMGGGSTSWLDLTLYLIARFVTLEEAMRVAKLHLIEWHQAGQQPFAVLSRSRQAADALIGRCQEWVAQHYDEPTPVATMAKLSGLHERTFKRRFAKATGMPPMEYVHALRSEEAKQMLEATELSVEAIANEVGYEDASFFGRLFRRRVGMTPAQYRRRFGGLRKVLQARLTTDTRADIAARPQSYRYKGNASRP